MKKCLAGLLLVLLWASSGLAPAEAQVFSIQQATRPLTWRTSCLTCLSGYTDSSYFSHGSGNFASAQQLDTTAAFSLLDLRMPPGSYGPSALNTDSVAVMNLVIHNKASTTNTEAGDTILVSLQFSFDGGNSWNTADGRGANGSAVLELQTNENYPINYFQRTTAAGATGIYHYVNALSTATAPPTTQSILAFPLVRWIVQGDMTGDYEATVTGYWQLQNP